MFLPLRGDTMHVFIVYAHPSEESFTHSVLLAFINGINHNLDLSLHIIPMRRLSILPFDSPHHTTAGV